ncbi:MAG: hypothetical protein JWL60_1685 [Gemmatimonadetes bacterium]|jgi:hypothetical protein|nr:hypothetical protein [Gemmatimonadota bacterium]
MPDTRPNRPVRPAAETRAPSPSRRPSARQSIDCGGGRDQESVQRREFAAADSRHGCLTAGGCYADQAQAI